MSRENVEVVRGVFEAFARRDNERVFAFYDPEFEFHSDADGRIYRGYDGVRDFFRDWLAVWDDFEQEVEEWIDAGDHVIAVIRTRGRGKQSGVRVEQRQAHVWTLRNRKLSRLRIFPTRKEALEAVGLREEAAGSS